MTDLMTLFLTCLASALSGAIALRWFQMKNESLSIRQVHRMVAQSEYAKEGLRRILDRASSLEMAHKMAGATLEKMKQYE